MSVKTFKRPEIMDSGDVNNNLQLPFLSFRLHYFVFHLMLICWFDIIKST